jgi:hypothetical protein
MTEPNALTAEQIGLAAARADALVAAYSRIAELEEALRPFAEIATGEIYDRFVSDHRNTFRLTNEDFNNTLTFINAECFDAARTALSQPLRPR